MKKETKLKELIKMHIQDLQCMINDPIWRKGWLIKRLERKSAWTTQKSIKEYLTMFFDDMPDHSEGKQLLRKENKDKFKKVIKEVQIELKK